MVNRCLGSASIFRASQCTAGAVGKGEWGVDANRYQLLAASIRNTYGGTSSATFVGNDNKVCRAAESTNRLHSWLCAIAPTPAPDARAKVSRRPTETLTGFRSNHTVVRMLLVAISGTSVLVNSQAGRYVESYSNR